jgi:hypothetical protein
MSFANGNLLILGKTVERLSFPADAFAFFEALNYMLHLFYSQDKLCWVFKNIKNRNFCALYVGSTSSTTEEETVYTNLASTAEELHLPFSMNCLMNNSPQFYL